MSTAAYNAPSDARNPGEAALLARIQRWFQVSYRALSSQQQARALSAKDDFWTVMEMLALAPIEEPELRVRMRGVIARRELLESEGGILTPSNVAELLGISRQAVGQRRAANKLLAVDGARGYVYPAWQFGETDVLDGIVEILEVLACEDSWTKLIFFLSDDDTIGGKRPIDLLRKGKLEQVRRAARMHGEHGAA